MKNVGSFLCSIVLLSIFGIVLFADVSLTAGAYLLCSIVLLSIGIVPIFFEKDKQIKVRLFILCGIVFTLTLGIRALIDVYWNKKEMHTPAKVTEIATLDRLPVIVPESGRELGNLVNTEHAQMKSSLTRETESLLAKWNFRPLLESDKQKIAAMMAEFEDLESMSESDILDTLVGFLPETFQKSKLYPQFVSDFYKGLESHVPSYDKDEKVLITVNFLYNAVASYKDRQARVAEAIRRDAALKAADPDLYYKTMIQEERDKIAATEQKILDAEAKGDTEWADFQRKNLAFSHQYIKDLEFERDFDENVNAMVAEGLRERLPQVDAAFQARLREIIAEYEAAANPVSPKDTGASAVVSEPSEAVTTASTPSDPVGSVASVYDPVRSLTSAQATLKSWRSDFDESYLDVIASRYMSSEELAEFFPTAQERQILKSRTSELRAAVVSKVRSVVSQTQGATSVQKLELARQLVSSNFDADFAESVLEQLDFSDN